MISEVRGLPMVFHLQWGAPAHFGLKACVPAGRPEFCRRPRAKRPRRRAATSSDVERSDRHIRLTPFLGQVAHGPHGPAKLNYLRLTSATYL